MIRRFIPLSCLCAAVPIGLMAAEEKPVNKEDPAATKLLADARAARAQWGHFPGFRGTTETPQHDAEAALRQRVVRSQTHGFSIVLERLRRLVLAIS